MTTADYLRLRAQLMTRGYAEEIEWAQSVRPPTDPEAFACEYVWVVLNSGMKNQVAARIWERVRPVLERGGSATEAFHHPGKSQAIDFVWSRRDKIFREYLASENALTFCRSLPWIGPITQYHLAKNLGADVAKPDRHLVRVAAASAETPSALCERLSGATGDRIATVDLVVWRSANLGLVHVDAGALVISLGAMGLPIVSGRELRS